MAHAGRLGWLRHALCMPAFCPLHVRDLAVEGGRLRRRAPWRSDRQTQAHSPESRMVGATKNNTPWRRRRRTLLPESTGRDGRPEVLLQNHSPDQLWRPPTGRDACETRRRSTSRQSSIHGTPECLISTTHASCTHVRANANASSWPRGAGVPAVLSAASGSTAPLGPRRRALRPLALTLPPPSSHGEPARFPRRGALRRGPRRSGPLPFLSGQGRSPVRRRRCATQIPRGKTSLLHAAHSPAFASPLTDIGGGNRCPCQGAHGRSPRSAARQANAAMRDGTQTQRWSNSLASAAKFGRTLRGAGHTWPWFGKRGPDLA